MGDFLPWVPIGTLSGGRTKSPSKAAGRVLGAEAAAEKDVSHEQKQARRAELDNAAAREDRRKLHEERRVARRLSQPKSKQAKAGEAASLRGAGGNGN